MATAEEAQHFVDEMARKNGAVRDYYKVMAKHDFPVLKASTGLIDVAYREQRLLDLKTKELLIIMGLTVTRANLEYIEIHIRHALDAGATHNEILEVMELALIEAGIVAFYHGVDAFITAVDAEGLEPTAGAV